MELHRKIMRIRDLLNVIVLVVQDEDFVALNVH
jgi:hypothetical protein